MRTFIVFVLIYAGLSFGAEMVAGSQADQSPTSLSDLCPTAAVLLARADAAASAEDQARAASLYKSAIEELALCESKRHDGSSASWTLEAKETLARASLGLSLQGLGQDHEVWFQYVLSRGHLGALCGAQKWRSQSRADASELFIVTVPIVLDLAKAYDSANVDELKKACAQPSPLNPRFVAENGRRSLIFRGN